MRVAIGDVRPTRRDAFADGRLVDEFRFAELHVDATLPDAVTGHAGEIGFAGDFERESTVEDVVPTIPFGDAVGVHRADEIADAQRRRHADLLRPDAVHFGDDEVRQLPARAVGSLADFDFADLAIPIFVESCERLR